MITHLDLSPLARGHPCKQKKPRRSPELGSRWGLPSPPQTLLFQHMAERRAAGRFTLVAGTPICTSTPFKVSCYGRPDRFPKPVRSQYSIPVWAGSLAAVWQIRRHRGVYLRVSGVIKGVRLYAASMPGLSPHERSHSYVKMTRRYYNNQNAKERTQHQGPTGCQSGMPSGAVRFDRLEGASSLWSRVRTFELQRITCVFQTRLEVTYGISEQVGCGRRSRVMSRSVPPCIQPVHFCPVQWLLPAT